MEEGLSQENYLRLALRLRCGLFQIILTSCLRLCLDEFTVVCGSYMSKTSVTKTPAAGTNCVTSVMK